MPKSIIDNRELWRRFSGPNLGYMAEQYERYRQSPGAVEARLREWFDRYGPPPDNGEEIRGEGGGRAGDAVDTLKRAADPDAQRKAIAAGKLLWNIRAYGHLAADIDPLELNPPPESATLRIESYGLTQADLEALPAEWVWKDNPYGLTNGWEAIGKLREVYSGTIAYEFSHVQNEEERRWLNRQAERELPTAALNRDERRKLLQRLLTAEMFEDFLQRTFVGQKRFSAEGVEAMVPMIEELVHELVGGGARHIAMGMAHRGRLNVLAHVLGKPYANIFSEFHHAPDKRLVPSEGSIGINYGWTGDVKYHLGANRFIQTGETAVTRLTLANNPSHLEFVNPVVAGFARAAQEDRSRRGAPSRRPETSAAIMIHGDAAFPGEGVVAETLNLNQLEGFTNSGSVHLIVNNRIGFTTESVDSRSTRYASDLAKGYEIPIVHVNADDPEACILASRLAAAYRTRFRKDFLIDLIGYRRYGHNESDDPETTQPLIYRKVKEHPSVARIYGDKLQSLGIVSAEEIDGMKGEILARLRDAHDRIKRQDFQDPVHQEAVRSAGGSRPEIVTSVPAETLRRINAGLLRWPEGFHVYPKLRRILERRASGLEDGDKVEWGHAETLAFATILADGKPIRISGQDAERATFAHRNLVLHDNETGAGYCPLHGLPEASAAFAIHNSPLSEAAVLGFEYGYSVYAPDTMVIWEAQYGDFANVAQVLFDQFLSAGYSKWKQRSGLTVLLPHGYEGQGPEHSSARLERFLQLSGESNWMVANLTTAAQYFHLLRRQAALCGTDAARPLVIMAPKSLIRHPLVASPATAFSEGGFRGVLEQPGLGDQPEAVERLVLCTGKIAVDLAEAIGKKAEDGADELAWLHVVRVEQLYPYPAREIADILARCPGVKEVYWVQEEPENMGAWRYMEPKLRVSAPAAAVRYVGRPERASPASGFQQVHGFEQQRIVQQALSRGARAATASENGGNSDV